jgi:hypothetical protein
MKIELLDINITYEGHDLYTLANSTSELPHITTIDPNEVWAGTHEGVEIDINLNIILEEADDIELSDYRVLLRLCSPTSKSYITAPEHSEILTEKITNYSSSIHLNSNCFPFGSEWYVDITIAHSTNESIYQLQNKIDRIPIFVKRGESDGSQLPLVIDKSINTLWELRWKTDDELSLEELMTNYPAQEVYEIAINSRLPDSEFLYEAPFDENHRWVPLALEVYSHVFTELIFKVEEIVPTESQPIARTGSIISFVNDLKILADIKADDLQLMNNHYRIYQKVKAALMKR